MLFAFNAFCSYVTPLQSARGGCESVKIWFRKGPGEVVQRVEAHGSDKSYHKRENDALPRARHQ